MPNKKSAIKHLRQTAKLTEKNNRVKKNIKDLLKKGEKALAAGKPEDLQKIGHALQKAIDKAVKNNILKANAGNRKKSRFMKKAKLVGNSKSTENK